MIEDGVREDGEEETAFTVFDATAAIVAAMLELTCEDDVTLLGFSGLESPEELDV